MSDTTQMPLREGDNAPPQSPPLPPDPAVDWNAPQASTELPPPHDPPGPPKAITFRRDTADGGFVIYATDRWPQQAIFSAAQLADENSEEMLVDTKKGQDFVNVTVGNGYALYSLAPAVGDGSRIGTFVEGEFFDPPEAVAPSSEPAQSVRADATPSIFIQPSTPEEMAPAPAPEPVPVDPLVALQSALTAPAHEVGYTVKTASIHPADAGLFQCGVDALGRVWRVEEREDGEYLVLAGRLTT